LREKISLGAISAGAKAPVSLPGPRRIVLN
jgi:hypothetical protein